VITDTDTDTDTDTGREPEPAQRTTISSPSTQGRRISQSGRRSTAQAP
jgi:hypothetical protein